MDNLTRCTSVNANTLTEIKVATREILQINTDYAKLLNLKSICQISVSKDTLNKSFGRCMYNLETQELRNIETAQPFKLRNNLKLRNSAAIQT